MMTRFMLAMTILSCAITPVALVADLPENSSAVEPAQAKAVPIYVKIIWPVDPATPVIERDSPVIESWVAKSIVGNEGHATSRAVTGWVQLVEVPFESTELWDGRLDGVRHTCHAHADISERKDGLITIDVYEGTGGKTTVTLKDEPGSREVVPVTQVKTKHGVPHVAIFIGLPVQ